MHSHLYHLQLNIDFKGFVFYKDLMTLLGWSVIFEEEDMAGYKSGNNGDVWFINASTPNTSDFDNRGVNHISFRVDKKTDVDKVVKFLKKNKVEALFETPRHRPEFSDGEDQTYYQVMFKTEDNLLFEVVYVGVKE